MPRLRHPDDAWTLADPRSVTQSTARVIDCLVDAIVPSEPRAPDTTAMIARHLRVMLQYMPRATAMGFVATLHLLNWSPLWRGRALRPMTSMTRERVRAMLGEVTQSRRLPIRLLLLGPQGLILSTYFDQDVAHQALDYDPQPFFESRIELRKKRVS